MCTSYHLKLTLFCVTIQIKNLRGPRLHWWHPLPSPFECNVRRWLLGKLLVILQAWPWTIKKCFPGRHRKENCPLHSPLGAQLMPYGLWRVEGDAVENAGPLASQAPLHTCVTSLGTLIPKSVFELFGRDLPQVCLPRPPYGSGREEEKLKTL